MPMETKFQFPWERAAMNGDEMPDGLSLPAQMAYTTLRNIYDVYYRKSLSREAAAAEKRKLRRQYEMAMESLSFQDKLTDHHVRVIRATEMVKAACRKNPTPENALRLCDVLDGLIREEVPIDGKALDQIPGSVDPAQ